MSPQCGLMNNMLRDSISNPDFELAQLQDFFKYPGSNFLVGKRSSEKEREMAGFGARGRMRTDGELTNGLRSGQPSRTLTHSLTPRSRSLSHTILDNRSPDSFFSISLLPQRITKLEKGFHHPLSSCRS